jgi:formate--tetrahydrofolate ligase
MKMNGGVKKEDLGKENVEAVRKGCANLGRHIENVRQFGVPAVVAINHFYSDTDAEIQAMKDYVKSMGEEAIVCRHWAQGSAGIEELAHKIVSLAESGHSQFAPLYPDAMPLFEKINTIVKRIYRGSEAIADKSVRDQLHQWEQAGYGNLPICMAKTQYSFSTDPNLRGAPNDHVVPVREVRLSAGAGFVVAICGEIMTMPGLPKAPSSEKIYLNEMGYIEGLF